MLLWHRTSVLEKSIDNYLRLNPGSKAKTIAKALKLEKAQVSKFLHQLEKYIQDDDFGWHIAVTNCEKLELYDGWVPAASFEKSLAKCENLFSDSVSGLQIVFPKKCAVMLDAGARILFLANRLVLEGKKVELQFCEGGQALTYLDRAGFFIHLNEAVLVTPARPEKSLANSFKGNAPSLVELESIDIDNFDESIPNELTSKFVGFAGEELEGAAYNVFSELCNNVVEHSGSQITGIAGLQMYKGNSPHIQIVISDGGLGIVKTLRPALEQDKSLDFTVSDISDAELIAKAFSEGGLSRLNKKNDDGRGLGLLKSSKGIRDHGATLHIRQETMFVKLRFEDNKMLIVTEKYDLPRLPGTHICFDFKLA